MNQELYDNIYAIVEEIPKGCVASYAQIARLAGYPRNARLVGRALRFSHLYGSFPCHRVVHGDGSLTVGWDEQKSLLEEEGVTFIKSRVDMKQHQWKLDISNSRQ